MTPEAKFHTGAKVAVGRGYRNEGMPGAAENIRGQPGVADGKASDKISAHVIYEYMVRVFAPCFGFNAEVFQEEIFNVRA